MNVLITGGCGYIGSHMTNLLVDKGCKVTVIDNLRTRLGIEKGGPIYNKVLAAVILP